LRDVTQNLANLELLNAASTVPRWRIVAGDYPIKSMRLGSSYYRGACLSTFRTLLRCGRLARPEDSAVPLFDTTGIHVEEAVKCVSHQASVNPKSTAALGQQASHTGLLGSRFKSSAQASRTPQLTQRRFAPLNALQPLHLDRAEIEA
jgi:hypothetical protein